ncbi:MAG: HAD hydrolase-like protein [Candidatus Aenigmatarchaeota archaeon]
MTKLLRYSVYLFDADGPLINSVDAALATTNRVLESFDLEQLNLETWRATPKSPWKRFYTDHGVPKKEVDEALRRYVAFFGEVTHTAAKPEEVEETLMFLRSRNIGVVTDMHRIDWDNYCNRFGFDKYIHTEAVITCDDCDERKPSPKPLYLAMERLGVSKKKIREHKVRGIMIGDSPVDIIAGRAAGLDTAAVYYHGSYNNEERLLAQKPTYMIERISIIADRQAFRTKRVRENPSILG